MRKLTKLIILVIGIFLIIPFMKVNAESIPNVLTLDASIEGNKLTVNGTTEDGVLAVAIFVYDETDENLVAMQTTACSSENTYSDKIDVPNAKYVVKAVNYEGGNYVTKIVSAIENTTSVNQSSTNPNTGDNITKFIILFLISTLGIATIVIVRKKKANN